jgi:shikimate kinase
MIVFLIGMPACGKTRIGKRLAKKIPFTLIDLDKYLAVKENSSIPKIFKEKGESYFRELENKYLKEISQTTANSIISVGGGTPCFHKNMENMLSVGIVFYLNTPIETLMIRLQEDTKRPLFADLSGHELKEKVNTLLQQREPFYLQAHQVIDTAGKSDEAVVTEISKCIAISV